MKKFLTKATSSLYLMRRFPFPSTVISRTDGSRATSPPDTDSVHRRAPAMRPRCGDRSRLPQMVDGRKLDKFISRHSKKKVSKTNGWKTQCNHRGGHLGHFASRRHLGLKSPRLGMRHRTCICGHSHGTLRTPIFLPDIAITGDYIPTGADTRC